VVEGHTKHKGEVIFVRLARMEEECSCNNCLARSPESAYKLYFGNGSNTTTTMVLCGDCLLNLNALIDHSAGILKVKRTVRRVSMSVEGKVDRSNEYKG